jgi:uncharacterized SAM-binding protein YcdF (DUF218 family)
MAWFLSPLAWLTIAAVLLGFAWLKRRRHAWPFVVATSAAALVLGAMTPFGSNLLVSPLERPVVVPDSCTRSPPSSAVVLGGGVDGWARDDGDFSALNLASRRRMDRAVQWWREADGRTLVLQGGSPHPRAASIAGLMASYARSRGLPAAAIRTEAESGDTWENAELAARLAPQVPRRVVLVTSAMHMPRARLAFAHAGFDVCPIAADSRRLPSRLPWALVPRTSALASTEIALHEWAGLAWYRWRTRQ